MGADSSKENSRNSTPEQNRSQNHRPRQYVYEQAAPAYQGTRTYQSPPQTQQVHIDRSRNPTQDLQNIRKQTIQPNNLERARNPYNYTTQDLTANQGSSTTLERSRSPYNYTTQDLTSKQGAPNTLERSRQPYNLSTEHLQNATQAKPHNLYPNLSADRSDESFVVVNNNGQIRGGKRADGSPDGKRSPSPIDTCNTRGVTSALHFTGCLTPTPKHNKASTAAWRQVNRSNTQPSAPPATEVSTPPVTRTVPIQQFTPSQNASRPSNSANPSANMNRNRPRSAVRTHNNNDTLSCPTCSQRLGIAIFQCSGGHSSCKDCRAANRSCGTCMSPITGMRNIMLEAYIAELKTPCPNQGCTWSFNADEMERHLKECPFGEMDCPMGTFFGQCTTRCKVADMAAHFDIFHKEQRTAEIDKEMYVFNICTETHKMYLIKNGPHTYLVHLKVGEKERKIFMTVQLLGSNISAQKWTYEFHVYNKRQPSRKFLYADSCQSIGKPVDEIFKENHCATLPLPYAMTFVNESTLTYKFYIKKEINQRTRRGGPKKTVNAEN